MGLDDDQTPDTPPAADPPAAPARRRRNRATTTTPTRKQGRLERRAEAVKTTIQEAVRLRRPDLDVEGKTFVEVVERDADAWGSFVAQMAERFDPLAQLVDLVFGAPLMALIGLAPSVRAARRDLAKRRDRQKSERAAAQAEQNAAGTEHQPPAVGEWQPAEQPPA